MGITDSCYAGNPVEHDDVVLRGRNVTVDGGSVLFHYLSTFLLISAMALNAVYRNTTSIIRT